MSILTGAGMKMVLPAVLAGLSETAWRSKQVGCTLSLATAAPS